ncbi:glycosyltransferase [Halalkalicoccus salilacus]|uniref:glycosyltransferase n=1 Tax=Halalkalicoccus TaxID=332246 RepID=UPI002F962EC1
MRPAFLINDLQNGGAERLVKDIAIQMGKYDDIDPIVILANDIGELKPELEASDVELISLDVDVSTTSIPSGVRALSALLQERDVDLVHSHLSFSHVIGRLACARRSVPHVATYHNVREHKTLAKQLAERATRPLSKRIVCVSEGVRQSYSNTKNMEVIYNAIDVETFNERVTEADTTGLELDLSDDTMILLNVARCVEQKRQQDLIEAMDYLAHDDIHLFIVGNGPRRSFLEELVAKKGLDDQVTVTGYVEAIEPYYAIADVFVSSSSMEGLPTTHIEAMAAELPIVSTNIPGVREIVKEGTNGFLSAVGEPRMLSSRIELVIEEGHSFGKHGYDLARSQFSIDSIAEQHVKLYREINNRSVTYT